MITPKNYLLEIHSMKRTINRLEQMLSEIHIQYSSSHAIDYSRDKVQTSPVNGLELAAWDMMERKSNIENQIRDLRSEVNKRIRMINELSGKSRDILYERYVNDSTLCDIAKAHGSTPKTIRNRHALALHEFSDLREFQTIQEYSDKSELSENSHNPRN